MADEEKIIRIEAEVKGDSEPSSKPSAPISNKAGGTPEPADNRQQQEKVQRESEDRDRIRDIANAIMGRRDESFSVIPPGGNAGGGGGSKVPPPPGGGSPPPPPDDEPPNYGRFGGALVVSGMGARTAGTALMGMGGGGAGAGATAAGGAMTAGGGGAIATTGAATATAAGGTAAAAGTALFSAGTLSALAGVLIITSYLTTAFIVLTGTVTLVTELLTDLYNSGVALFEDISPRLQLANAQRDLTLLMAKIKAEERVVGKGFDFTSAVDVRKAQTDREVEQIQLLSKWLDIASPFIELMNRFAESCLQLLNIIVEGINALSLPAKLVAKASAKALEWFNKIIDIEGDPDVGDQFLADVEKVLSGEIFPSPLTDIEGPKPQSKFKGIMY